MAVPPFHSDGLFYAISQLVHGGAKTQVQLSSELPDRPEE